MYEDTTANGGSPLERQQKRHTVTFIVFLSVAMHAVESACT